MSSPSMRCRTAAEAPRDGALRRGEAARRGSLSEEALESEEELGGRLTTALRRCEATTGAFFGAGALGAALPLGRPRGRFTGASGSGTFVTGGTGGARANGAGDGGSFVKVGASSAFVFSGASIGSRITSIYFNDFFNSCDRLWSEQ